MKYKTVEYEERYFIGVEFEGGITPGSNPLLGEFWNTFLDEDLKLIIDIPNKEKFIGLECYPPDFKESNVFYYYALMETDELIKRPGFSSKKLPKGKYLLFEVSFDTLHDDIQNVYQYIKDNNINIHFGFDYEDYLKGQNYNEEGAILNFAIKLEE